MASPAVILTVRLPVEIDRRMRVEAISAEQSIKEYVVEALESRFRAADVARGDRGPDGSITFGPDVC